MKLVSVFLLLTLVTASTAISQNATFIADEISQISPCGLSCLAHTIPSVGCTVANVTCQCESAELVDRTTACMMTNCTITEAFDLSKIQAAICEPSNQSQNRKIRILTITCAIITNGAAFIRFTTRILLRQNFGLDDWFIAAAVLSDAIFAIFGVQLENNGFGAHVWNINEDAIPHLFFWFYICEIMYVMTIGFIKVSILFFYLRVFPKKSFRVAVWATMAFCGLGALSFAIVTIFQCHPVIYTWEKELVGGRCVNYNSVAWANAAVNIFQDIIIILLPMNELRHLQLNKKKKAGMYAMFGVGGFVCVISIIRLESLRTFGLTSDPTWDNIPTTFWSTLETSTAVFCACMPSIRAGLVRLFPKVLGATSHHMSLGIGASKEPFDSASHGGLDSKPSPFRSVEDPEPQSIILSPLKLNPEPKQAFTVKKSLSPGTNPTSAADAKHDTTHKELTVQVAGLTTAKKATYIEYDKSLPVTPTSEVSVSIRPSTTTSTETEDRREDAENSDDTGNLNLPRTSHDTSRLV